MKLPFPHKEGNYVAAWLAVIILSSFYDISPFSFMSGLLVAYGIEHLYRQQHSDSLEDVLYGVEAIYRVEQIQNHAERLHEMLRESENEEDT